MMQAAESANYALKGSTAMGSFALNFLAAGSAA
jgi:hypothetical protein